MRVRTGQKYNMREEGSALKRISRTASEISREILEAYIKTSAKKTAGPLAKTSEWFLNIYTEPQIINNEVK